jgi:hypothetical protein
LIEVERAVDAAGDFDVARVALDTGVTGIPPRTKIAAQAQR